MGFTRQRVKPGSCPVLANYEEVSRFAPPGNGKSGRQGQGNVGRETIILRQEEAEGTARLREIFNFVLSDPDFLRQPVWNL